MKRFKQLFTRNKKTEEVSKDPGDIRCHGLEAEGSADNQFESAFLGEKLLDQDMQYWALGLCVLVLPVVIWAEGADLSCSSLDEHQKQAPGRCKGIIGDVRVLRLPDFCWRTCLGTRMVILLCSLSMGLVLQGVVVILNHGGCQKWMNVSTTFDCTKEMDDFDEEMSKKIEAECEGEDARMKRYFKAMVGKAVKFMKNLFIQKARAQASQRSAQGLVQAKRAGSISKVCVIISALRVVFLGVTGYSAYSSFFECTNADGDLERVVFPSNTNYFHVLGLIVAFVMLVIIYRLQKTAEWTTQVKFSCMPLRNLKDGSLRSQFTRKWYPKDLSSQESKVDEKNKKFKVFSLVPLQKLMHIEHDGYKDTPEEAFKCREWSGPVTFHFVPQRNFVVPDNQHRVLAILALGFAACGLTVASSECWTCVSGIHAVAGDTVVELEDRFFLLGSCGRHSTLGHASHLGGLLAVFAFVLQLLIVRLTDANYNGGPALHKAAQKIMRQDIMETNNVETQYPGAMTSFVSGGAAMIREQLWVKVFDSQPSERKPIVYKESEVAMPQFYCHTWVIEENGIETPVDCETEDRDRWRWQQSKQPIKVTLADPKEDPLKLERMMSGLVREDYTLPITCIEFEVKLDKDGKVVKKTENEPNKGVNANKAKDQDAEKTQTKQMTQMVPRQFHAGRCHVWLNLGSKLAWEKVSASFCFLAFVLGMVDILIFFVSPRGTVLSSCDDVLNDKCMYIRDVQAWYNNDVITFRRSMGWIMTLWGSGFALFSCLCLRVAHRLEAQHELKDACAEYMLALTYSFNMAFQMVKFVFGSFWRCAMAFCNKHCFCCQVEHVTDDEQPLLAGDASPAVSNYD